MWINSGTRFAAGPPRIAKCKHFHSIEFLQFFALCPPDCDNLYIFDINQFIFNFGALTADVSLLSNTTSWHSRHTFLISSSYERHESTPSRTSCK